METEKIEIRNFYSSCSNVAKNKRYKRIKKQKCKSFFQKKRNGRFDGNSDEQLKKVTMKQLSVVQMLFPCFRGGFCGKTQASLLYWAVSEGQNKHPELIDYSAVQRLLVKRSILGTVPPSKKEFGETTAVDQ